LITVGDLQIFGFPVVVIGFTKTLFAVDVQFNSLGSETLRVFVGEFIFARAVIRAESLNYDTFALLFDLAHRSDVGIAAI
jgi:hypothetical protein